MNRLKHFEREVKEASAKLLRDKMGSPKMIDAEFCNDLPNEYLTTSWSSFRIAAGIIPVNDWIAKNGFTLCKKSEASCLLRIGEKKEDCWLIGKYKNYWLTLLPT